MIFAKERDPRLVTVRRGGTLQDADHHLLAFWAADCAEHVLHLFEHARPGDDRPRRAIGLARAWARGEITMTQARTAAFISRTASTGSPPTSLVFGQESGPDRLDEKTTFGSPARPSVPGSPSSASPDMSR
jgi:hypothetical protein